MMLRCTLDDPTTDWLIEHPESAAVFAELGLDHHCGGKSLDAACRECGLDGERVLAVLRRFIEAGPARNP